MTTARQLEMVDSYIQLQSLRLVALKFGVKKPTVHSAIKRSAPGILRKPYISYKWERPKTRRRRL